MAGKIYFYDEEKIAKINPETIKYWNRYKMDMELRELSQGTQDGYYNDLLHWWIYVYDHQGNRCITELDEDEITEFLYFCKKNGNSTRRMRRRMASISAFYKYLRKKKIIRENPMEFIDRPTKDIDVAVQTFLTFEQVEAMRDAFNTKIAEAKTPFAKHNWTMLRLYAFFSLSTMARINAVSNTRWEQVDFDARIVGDVVEKEGYIVDLYFSEAVKQYMHDLQECRAAYGIDDKGYVFVSYVNGVYEKATKGALSLWCKKIGGLIDVPTLHAHDFRHSGSQLMLLAGAKIEDISEQLNHKGLDVTKKHYLRTDKNKVREKHDKYCL